MKKNIVFLLLALILTNCSDNEPEVKSTGTWKQFNDFPTQGRNASVTFSLLGKGYWGFGSNTSASFLREIWSYEPTTDSWTQKNDFPFDLPAEAAVTANGKGYVITYSGSLYQYTPGTDTWEYSTSCPVPGVNIVAFALGSDIFILKGGSKDFWKYSLSQEQWTQQKDFPGEGRLDAVSFVVGDKGYIGLGFSGPGAPPIHKDLYRYDAVVNDWEQIADFPTNKAIVGMVFSNNTNAYIGIPINDATHKGQVFEYNVSSNSWREMQEFPSSNSLETRSFFINDRMFVVGGWWSEISSQVWEFIP